MREILVLADFKFLTLDEGERRRVGESGMGALIASS
jgi:hypothetical protein